MDLNLALAEAEKRLPKTTQRLMDLVKIPSVSFPGFDPGEVAKCADACVAWLTEVGMASVQKMTLPGSPVYVVAKNRHVPGRPTVLYYAHYDVQPPMREALWKSPAFTPTERDGRLYGRGAADDKAGVALALAAAEAFLKSGQDVPVNLTILLDGEEEVGSPHFGAFLRAHKDLLKSDVLVVADLNHHDTGIPALTTTLRGIVPVVVELRALDKPLHSGMWGGSIPDPVMGMAKLLSTLVDEKGRIAIPGVYDGIVAPTPSEVAALKALDPDDAVFRSQATVRPAVPLSRTGEGVFLATWREPSLLVNTFDAGSKKTAGNVLMDSAWARVSIRIVPGQDPQRISDLLVAAMKQAVPWGLEAKFHAEPPAPAWITDTRHPAFAAMKRALSVTYGREALEIGCGGTIPFVPDATAVLGGIPALLIPVEDPHSNAHGENESLHLGDFKKSLLSQVRFFAEMASK